MQSEPEELCSSTSPPLREAGAVVLGGWVGEPRFVEAASVHRLLSDLCDRWPIERIILFGSRAVGDHDPRSDVDLAVSAPALSKQQWIFVQDFISESDTLFKVAVSSLDGMPPSLREQVLMQGVVIYDVAQGPRQSE